MFGVGLLKIIAFFFLCAGIDVREGCYLRARFLVCGSYCKASEALGSRVEVGGGEGVRG